MKLKYKMISSMLWIISIVFTALLPYFRISEIKLIWIPISIYIIVQIIIYFSGMIPNYSSHKWLKWLYNQNLNGEYKAKMFSNAYVDEGFKEFTNEISWDFHFYDNDFICVQKNIANKTTSTSKLLQMKHGKKIIRYHFEYYAEKHKSQSKGINSHKGNFVVRFSKKDKIIIDAQYFNADRGSGWFEEIEKI